MASLDEYSPHEPMDFGAEPITGEALLASEHMSSGDLAENFDLEETLLNNVAQNPRIERMIQDAMSGLMPLGRPLASYEPDKLNARHISVIMLRAVGYRQNRICELTGYSVGAVSVILRHPYSRAILAAILAEGAKQSIDISGQVRREAPKMLALVKEIANDRDVKPETRLRAGFGWLDMYTKLEEKQSSTESDTFKMDQGEANRLITAINESRQIVEVPYVLANKSAVPSPALAHGEQIGTAPDLLPGDPFTDAAKHRQLELEAELEAKISGLERKQGQADGAELGTPVSGSVQLSDISRSSVPGRGPAHRTDLSTETRTEPTSFPSPSAVGVRIERQGVTSNVEKAS